MPLLKDPPCIDRLIGCSGSTPPAPRAPFPKIRDRMSSSASSSLQSSSSTFDAARALEEAKSRLSSTANKVAMYTVTVRNVGSQAMTNASITHGPVPFGAVFNTAMSTAGCTLDTSVVRCALQHIRPGETKILSIAYDAGAAFQCEISKLLQSAKALVGGIDASSLAVSVTCEMRPRTASAVAQTYAPSTIGGFPITASTTSSSASAFSYATNADSLSYKQPMTSGDAAGAGIVSYKPYKPYDIVAPQSGISADLFGRVSAMEYTVMPVPHAPAVESTSFFWWIAILGFFALSLGLKRLRRS